jgi:hypothetical protein
VTPVLEVIADANGDLVLVGGQALNYWAEVYAPRLPALRAEAPFTSKDIDVIGEASQKAARQIARALHGQTTEPTIYEATAAVAVVSYSDPGGTPRVIDFLRKLHKVDVKDVERTALVLRPGLRVMHPVWCLESRVHNCLDLADYQTPEGYSQARAAVFCAREFLRDLLDAGEIQAVMELDKRIYQLAHHRAAQCAKHGLRPFEAVLVDERMPEKFLTEAYPRMVRAIEFETSRGRSGPSR